MPPTWLTVSQCSCDDTAQLVATCGKGADNSWQWSSDAVRCGARRLNVEGFQELLAGKWVSFIGDSITRNTYAAFLRLISPDGTCHFLLHAKHLKVLAMEGES